MWEKTYYIDVTTILTLMAIGAAIGYMLGKKHMEKKMLILITIVFLVSTFIFLDTTQPDMPGKISIVKEKPKAETTEEPSTE